ncbi:MAG: RagB/SusD family nutrient uptake outer membrane protein, partial [Flavisolibacter sp.]
PAFVNGSITNNMNAILEEYLREFIGEGKRWWALRRAGDAYVYAAIKPAYLSPTTVAKLLLPISTSMIANDPLLTQTPGY